MFGEPEKEEISLQFEDNDTSIKCYDSSMTRRVEVKFDVSAVENVPKAKEHERIVAIIYASDYSDLKVWGAIIVGEDGHHTLSKLQNDRGRSNWQKEYIWNPEHLIAPDPTNPDSGFQIHLIHERGSLRRPKTMIDVSEKGVFITKHNDIIPTSLANFVYNQDTLKRMIMGLIGLVKVIIKEFGQKTPSPPAS
ncbi:MAG: hypothetical protein Q9159_004839 [Coniocarpon cinnabarinum]